MLVVKGMIYPGDGDVFVFFCPLEGAGMYISTEIYRKNADMLDTWKGNLLSQV